MYILRKNISGYDEIYTPQIPHLNEVIKRKRKENVCVLFANLSRLQVTLTSFSISRRVSSEVATRS